MSGNQSALLGAGGGRWITNPKHMPLTRVSDANLFVKDAVNTVKAANNAAFYSTMALQGASSAITVADTFVTLLNYSGGGGFLFHIVAPTHSANFTPTIEVTADDVVTTLAPSAVFPAQSRLVLGANVPGFVISNSGVYNENQVPLVSGYSDIGFQGRIGGINTRATGVISLPDEQMIMSFNMPMLRWERSIVIRAKASLLSAVAVDKQCAVSYRTD